MASDLHPDDDASNNKTKSTLVVLGCGALGTAILLGILSSCKATLPFTHYIACVRRADAAEAVRSKVKSCGAAKEVSVLTCENVSGVARADVVLLAVQPHMVEQLLSEPGLKEVLAGKLIISVMAGVSTPAIESHLHSSGTGARSFVIRAMPNTACVTRQSTTVIERPVHDFPEALIHLTEALFQCVGQTFYINPSNMDVCTALCGSTGAFFTLVLEGLVEGAISLGLNHAVALQMAAHSMLGTSSMVLSGIEPQTIRHDVATPGGSTITGVLELEAGRVRSCLATALQVATSAASGLGSNQQRRKF